MNIELNNCLTEARMVLSCKNSDASVKIADALAAGRFVVVCEGPALCRSTDALAGSRRSHQADFATRAEADAAVLAAYGDFATYCGDERYYVLPELPRVVAPVAPVEDDGVPF